MNSALGGSDDNLNKILSNHLFAWQNIEESPKLPVRIDCMQTEDLLKTSLILSARPSCLVHSVIGSKTVEYNKPTE
jgi:hypothetical protein